MMLLETRALADIARMTVPLIGATLRPAPKRGAAHVIVLPGFGADDRATGPLRHFLDRRGFRAEGWGLGRNLAGLNLKHTREQLSPGWVLDPDRDYNGEGCVPFLADRVAERIRERHAASGEPVSLIGWSLGGYLAREAARDLPDVVERVITLGSPIVGGPKYTAAADTFRRRGLDLDWIEEVVRSREARPIRQPITAIYSRTDAIVCHDAAIDRYSENVTHIEVDAAHLGLAFNPTVWAHVLDALAGSG
jgi:pimeloyl-ACP methyl ester carboxylesterase